MRVKKIEHKYDDPALAGLIDAAVDQYGQLVTTLHAIQEKTGIPGLHTNINSDDPTPGVLERIQAIYDEDLPRSLEMFKSLDDDEAEGNV